MVESDGICPNWRSSEARHQRRDRVGIGAGKLRRHLNGRKIDLRQWRDGQTHEAHDAGEKHGEAQQRRRPPAG